MATKTRLRVHLVGLDSAGKDGMAKSLRAELSRRRTWTDFVIVPPLVDRVKERRPTEDVGFFMSLESEYLRYEADRDTKAKHLIFVDSIVDRFVRMEARGVDLGLYFLPRLRQVAQEAGSVFLYGPAFDAGTSAFIARHRLPFQAWSGMPCLDSVLEAVMIGLSTGGGDVR